MTRRRKKKPIRYTHPLLEPVHHLHLFKDNPVAKKKIKRKVAKSAKRTPAPGQKALPGVEDDRDEHLDQGAVAVAEAKRRKKDAAEGYDNALEEMGKRMHAKKRTSYTSAGLNFTASKEEKLKVTKAKDK